MADFISHYMDNNSNMCDDTQNSMLAPNREDNHGDFVLSCIDTQSENSQTYEFMKFHNSNKKESNLEVIREEDSIFNHMQQDYYDEPIAKKQNKDNLNSNKVLKSFPHENSKELLATNKKNKGSNCHSNNLTEKIKKISQEIDDIYEETQKSGSIKTKDFGVKDMSSVYTMNKGNSFQPANTVGNLNLQSNNHNNNFSNMSLNMNMSSHHNHGQNYETFNNDNQQSNIYGNFNHTNMMQNMMPKPYTPNLNNNPTNFSNNNQYQNPKLNLLNTINPNNISNNTMINSSSPNIISSNNNNNICTTKTKGKSNVNNYTGNISTNGTPIGFYNPNDANNTALPLTNKSISFPNNNYKTNYPSNYDLSNSFRIETDENIKKAVAIFDNIKLNFCNFIENYKNKFIYDAEMIKQVLVAESDHVIQEEEKNRLIDTRMEALFRDMMNILNEFQPRY